MAAAYMNIAVAHVEVVKYRVQLMNQSGMQSPNFHIFIFPPQVGLESYTQNG